MSPTCNNDLAPDRAAVVVCAPTHKACRVLEAKGLRGVTTLKSLLYKPIFHAYLDAARSAIVCNDIESWPDEPRLPKPDAARFARARAALTNSERDMWDALGVSVLDHIDHSQGDLGWRPREGARYRMVIVDEAGMVPRHEIRRLESVSDLVLMLGDQARQLQPVVTDEHLAHTTRDALASALAPSALAESGAEVYALSANMRQRNEMAGFSDLIFSPEQPTFDQVIRAIRAIPSARIRFVPRIPLDAVQAGVPVLCWQNRTRMFAYQGIHQARGWVWASGPVQAGRVVLVQSISRQLANSPACPRQLVRNSRWRVVEADERRCTLALVEDPDVKIANVALRIAEFPGKYTEKWRSDFGTDYPEFGPRFADVYGVAGETLTTHKSQGDTVPGAIVLLNDYRVASRMSRLVDDDGVATWRRLLNVALTRSRDFVYLVENTLSCPAVELIDTTPSAPPGLLPRV